MCPLTPKGTKVLDSMRKTYKSGKKAKQVFYAMINEGKLKGAEGTKKKAKKKKAKK
ncbi:MAG TPA: hypothetical protein VLH77_00040 [Gammaproteobacteria bacterium]|nr:hypothetical protein [Gammaproteobacteria bacterium]